MEKDPTKALWVLLGDLSKASSRVRAYWLAAPLLERGIRSEWLVGDSKLDLLHVAARMLSVDTVVFQKVYSQWHVGLARLARALGKRVIFDIDDAPSRSLSRRTIQNAERMMAAASVVTVGCQNLFDYARPFSKDVCLIPSCIDLGSYAPLEQTAAQTSATLGWIGDGAQYCQDLVEILVEPLSTIAQRSPIKLRIVGAGGCRELYEAFGAIPNLETELIDQIDWAAPGATRTAMEGVDIGLYPLLDNDFNRSKCGFKALEYMALGLPVVASPVGSNSNIVSHTVEGFLCPEPGPWVVAISQLVNSPEMRQRMGAAGRARVEGMYSTTFAAASLAEIMHS